MSELERRASTEEIHIEGTRGDVRRLEGLAATFGTEARIGDFTEVIRAGAFASSLESSADILALVDHDATKLLARTRSGFLKLQETRTGLHFVIELPSTTLAKDTLELVRSGNCGGMSIGFRVPKGGERWDGNVRELRSVELVEISVVSAFPAYGGTTIEPRARLFELHRRVIAARRWLATT